MFRTFICLAVVVLSAGSLDGASAQTTAPAPAASPAPTAPKPSRMKLTVEMLNEMKASHQQTETEGLSQGGEAEGAGRC